VRVPLERKVLNENDRIAAGLRERFRRNGTFCLNLISSPGSGKTALLERTLEGFDPARRVAFSPATSRPITTPAVWPATASRSANHHRGACHLDARMVERGLEGWPVEDFEILFLETSATWSAPPATIWARTRAPCCSALPKARTSRSSTRPPSTTRI